MRLERNLAPELNLIVCANRARVDRAAGVLVADQRDNRTDDVVDAHTQPVSYR